MVHHNNKLISNSKIVLLLTFAISLLSNALHAQQGSTAKPEPYTDKAQRGDILFQLQCSQTELSIADTFNLTLTAQSPDSIKIELPKLDSTLADNDSFGVLDSEKPQTRLLENGNTETTVTYRIEPLVTGSAQLPDLDLEYYTKNTGSDTPDLSTLTITGPKFTITDILPADGEHQLSDIKGPVELPTDYSKMLWLALAVFAVVIILLLIVYRMSKRQLTAPAIPQRPAHEIALERLNSLIAENLLQQGRVKEFYEKLSYIIRLYIEHRYSLKAPERTTEEFLQEASANPEMPDTFKDSLRQFLTHCDMVKFAKYSPTENEITTSTDLARNFIQSTADNTANVDDV